MPVDSILNYIIGQANEQKDKIIRQAKEEAAIIIRQAKEEADRLYTQAIAKETSLLERERRKLIVNANLKNRNNLLKAKQEIIDEAFRELKPAIKKDKFRKKQIFHEEVREVCEDIDFYLNNLRLEYEPEIAKILFS